LFSSECKKSEECIVPGIYALVGACAFLGGATRMTVSLVVIMVELTSGLSLIVPLMVSAFTAKLFGEFLCSGGIYDAHINLNGYPFLDNKEDYPYTSLAQDVMKPQKNDPPLTVLVQEGMTAKEIEELSQSKELTGFPIVISKESQYLFGYILKRDLKMAFGNL
jgi:chloride channel 3/4/5